MSETEAAKPREIEVNSQWIEFIDYCNTVQFGRLEKLDIQNGMPVFAEAVITKVKFTK